jgi:hypothetical protein
LTADDEAIERLENRLAQLELEGLAEAPARPVYGGLARTDEMTWLRQAIDAYRQLSNERNEGEMIEQLRKRLAALRLETRDDNLDEVNEAGLTRAEQIALLEGELAARERLAALGERWEAE